MRVKKHVVHRWQPTGFTPCGRSLKTVAWNEGRVLSDGVTCKTCKRANTFVSLGMKPHPARDRGADAMTRLVRCEKCDTWTLPAEDERWCSEHGVVPLTPKPTNTVSPKMS